MTILRLAAAQYPIGRPRRWADYAAGLARWVEEAARAGAELLVFPEYAAIELASIFGPAVEADLGRQLDAVAGLEAEVAALHRELAARCGVWILGGSMPARHADRFHNRAHLHGPDGEQAFQDKIVMTRFEREIWGVAGADRLTPMRTPWGPVGVCICYDVEFPLLARAFVAAGAALVLAPSCTETLRGYHRVRVGAMARALEGQCVTVQAPLVGAAPWSPAVDANRGAAGVYGPPDIGFPEDGVIAQGSLDRPGWVHATLDFERVALARREGTVLNFAHWPEQLGAVVAGEPSGPSVLPRQQGRG